MSDARGVENANDGQLDALSLSALLCSRLCHDLINPVGALEAGLDALDSPETDPALREAALDLVRSGAKKAVALLSFARLAYGVAGGYGAEISLKEAKKALEDVFELLAPELHWRLDEGMASKDYVKTLLILSTTAADCIPRGGAVAVDGDDQKLVIDASGQKI
jgi:histidine phosphotransferase ChpT